MPATGTTAITGSFGVLTIDANGSYSYVHTGAANGSDTFTYFLEDTDGDFSSAQLVITTPVSNAPIFNPIVGSQVFEAGLGPRTGEPAGSAEAADGNPNNNSVTSETASGTITFTSLDGVSAVTLADGSGTQHTLVAGTATTFADVVGGATIGQITAFYTLGAGNVDTISYTYVLTDNVHHTTSTLFRDNLVVKVTDSNGDTASGTLVVTIVDDAPIAKNDTDLEATTERELNPATGNVITGQEAPDLDGDNLVADILGADGGVHLTAVSFNGQNFLPTNGTITVTGNNGTLVIDTAGNYSYFATGWR